MDSAVAGINGVIRVQRSSSPIGMAGRLHVYVDNQKVGSLWIGGKLDYPVSPGTHSVEVKATFWTSSEPLQVVVEPGGIVRLRCGMGVLRPSLEFEAMDIQQAPADAAPQAIGIQVTLKDEVERIRVATEEVSVPPGVTIRVSRSRTIEHTIEYERSGDSGAERGGPGI